MSLPSWSSNFSGGGAEIINKERKKPENNPYFGTMKEIHGAVWENESRVSVRWDVQGGISEDVSQARTH